MRIKKMFERFIFTLVIIALSFGNTYAQHFFSVNYNELSREDAKRVKEQVIRSSVLPAPLTRDVQERIDAHGERARARMEMQLEGERENR